jgi:uncharacterized protein (TIGR03067 family)
MRATVLAVAATLAATAVFGEEALSGQWIAISAAVDGAPSGDLVGRRLTFEGDGFRMVDTEGAVVASGTFAADPAADPATIDFAGTTADGAAADSAGIWKRDGTLLTIVDNAPDASKPRPDAFAAPAGSGHAMVVFTPWQ